MATTYLFNYSLVHYEDNNIPKHVSGILFAASFTEAIQNLEQCYTIEQITCLNIIDEGSVCELPLDTISKLNQRGSCYDFS